MDEWKRHDPLAGLPSRQTAIPGAWRWMLVLIAMAAIGDPSAAQDAALKKEYVRQLRDLGYADLAIEYLEEQLKRPGISPAEKADLEFEIAASLITASESLADLSRREQMLEVARQKFQDYIRNHPDDDALRQGEALVHVATIDLQQGRLRIVQAQIPSNAGQAVALANQARALFTKASEDYDKAYRLFLAEYKKMPVFIPDETRDDRLQRQEKSRRFEKYIEARFQAALSAFYLADSYVAVEIPLPSDPNDANARKAHEAEKEKWAKRYKDAIEDARKGFEAIYTEHRRELVGLYGHLWMARCMAAQGDHRRAMGIFELLLEHDNPELARFQRDVFYFSMLSFAARKENDQIRNRGEPWLRQNQKFSREPSYLGVQMELAKALIAEAEKADDKTRQSNVSEANRLLERLGSFPNEYTGLARREQIRLSALGGAGLSGRTFNQLFSLANAKLDLLKADTPAEERAKLLAETRKLLVDAIDSAGPTDSIDAVNDARLALVFTLLQSDAIYEGAILADYLARTFPRSRAAPQAALFETTAYAWAYESAKKLADQNVASEPEVDADHLRRSAGYLFERWPESKEADEARLTLGRLEFSLDQFSEALSAFDAVTSTSTLHAEARGLAGIASWEAYKRSVRDGAASAELLTKASDRLAEASPLLRRAMGDRWTRSAFANDAVLAEVRYEQGQDVQSLEVSRPLVDAIEKGTLAADVEPALRTNVLITALQCHIRQNQLDQTDRLIGLIGGQQGSESSAGVTRVFISLAARIKEQIDRLRAGTDANRLAQTVAAFQQFLERVAQRSEGQDLNSRVYLSDNFIELGNYPRAIELLEAALRDPDASREDRQAIVVRAKVLLARSLRLHNDLARARTVIDDVTRSNNTVPEVLVERGEVLDAQADDTGKSDDAIKHWKWVIQRMQRSRPKPDTFYLAMDKLLTLYEKLPAAEKAKRKSEGYRYAQFLLTTDPQLSAAWRAVFEKHAKAFAP